MSINLFRKDIFPGVTDQYLTESSDRKEFSFKVCQKIQNFWGREKTWKYTGKRIPENDDQNKSSTHKYIGMKKGIFIRSM